MPCVGRPSGADEGYEVGVIVRGLIVGEVGDAAGQN